MFSVIAYYCTLVMEKAPAAVVGIAKQMWDVLTVQLLGFSSWLSTNWSDVRWRVTGPTWWCSYLLFACWQMVNINNQSKSMLTPTGVKINEESGESWRPAVCLLLCAGVERATHSVWTRFQTEVIPKNIFCFGLLWGKLYLYKIIIKHE